MVNESSISKRLIEAYRSTNYVVETEPAFTLRVGKHSEELTNLYTATGVDTACFITAYNPFSVLLTTPHNVARQAELLNDLAELKLKFVFGYGQSDASDWREASVLILGVSYGESMKLAVEHEQNAFIWCGKEATPAMVLTR